MGWRDGCVYADVDLPTGGGGGSGDSKDCEDEISVLGK